MAAVTPGKVASILEAADLMRKEIVVCLQGEPGIGKTQGVRDFAAKHGRNVVEMIASQILPSEVSGITMPDDETGTMRFYVHARLASLKNGDVLFFDELLQAPPQVLAACLTLIQERRIPNAVKADGSNETYELPDILIVAACNPDYTAMARLSPSIRQRFMFLDVRYDEGEWVEHVAKRHGLHPTEDIKRLVKRSMSPPHPSDVNVVSPRTATKLMLWARSVRDAGDEVLSKAFEVAAESMYNVDAQWLYDSIDGNISPKRQVFQAAWEAKGEALGCKPTSLGGPGDMLAWEDSVEDMTTADLLRLLENDPCWDEIRAALEGIELKG